MTQIDEVSQHIGKLVANSDNLAEDIAEVKMMLAARAVRVEEMAQDLAVVKVKITAMEPQVRAFNEVRLKALGALAGMAMLAGLLGSYLAKKVGIA